MVHVEFIVMNLFIVKATKLYDDESMPNCLQELWEMAQPHFLVEFHRSVEKERQKAWHERLIKNMFLFCFVLWEIKCFNMIVSTLNILRSCKCTGWVLYLLCK